MSAVDIRDSTIDRVVGDAARANPDGLAVTCGNTSITYGQLQGTATGFASWLKERGLVTGNTVSIWLPNGLAWVVAQVAIAQAGGVLVPVSTKLQTEEVHYIVSHSGSKFLVVANDFLNRDFESEARVIAEDVGCITVGTGWNSPHLPQGTASTVPGSAADAPAILQYTSGTTGSPKGCMLSHRTWTNNARISASLAGVDGHSVIFTPSPFFHLFGSLTALMGAFTQAARLITVPLVEPNDVAEQIDRSGADHMVAVPTVWLDLMSTVEPTDLPSLNSGLWGGAGFPLNKLERAIVDFGWNLQAVYGMTEAPTITQVRPEDTFDNKLGTVGTPTPGVEVRLMDHPDGDHAEPEGTGEILARGYNQMLGYFNDSEATEGRFQEGWIRTGDVGRITESGHLIIEGRMTDMIITGGANVYSREVEAVLMRIPGIELAAVVGASDERLGEVPVAFVQLASSSDRDEARIREFCRGHLAAYKVPRAIHILETMPLTGSGKIEKAALQRRLANEGG